MIDDLLILMFYYFIQFDSAHKINDKLFWWQASYIQTILVLKQQPSNVVFTAIGKELESTSPLITCA